jgi:hypothetical protein
MPNIRSLRRVVLSALFAVAASVAAPWTARAAGKEAWVPPVEPSGKPQLKLKVSKYEGGTNGELTVEVTNPGTAPADFDAQGLYFVPTGDPDHAPQRLGAVGPFQVTSEQGTPRRSKVTLPPGGKATLRLDVYCIDSHRRSPRTGDDFELASARMPKQLASEIQAEAGKAAAKVGGYAAPAAKASVQSEVWKARDKKWIKLDGEGNQEAVK